MKPDFHSVRRGLEPPAPSLPRPIGWRREGTYPLVNEPTSGDPFDTRPSRNPYPAGMPSLDAQAMSGPGSIDVHVRASRHFEKIVHDGGIIVDGGDPSRLGEVQTAILRAKALAEEMGTGVVTLTPRAENFLAMTFGDFDEATS